MFTPTWSRRNAASTRCLNPWGSNTPIAKRHACWLSGETRVGAITDECLESNGSIIEKIPPKGVRFSDFISIFAVSYKSFACFYFATLRQVEILTWQNSGPLGFPACHKRELFVAQALKKENNIMVLRNKGVTNI